MRQHKPAWWQLYALVPLMIGLLLVEHLDPLPGISAELAALVIVMLTFGAMLAWMHLNSGLIEYDEMQRDKTFHDLKIIIYDPQADTSQDAEKLNLWSPFMSPHPVNSISAPPQVEREDIEQWSRN